MGVPGRADAPAPFYRIFEAWFDSPEHFKQGVRLCAVSLRAASAARLRAPSARILAPMSGPP
jgi:hypothetical protein